MSADFGPGIELARRIVEVLTDDSTMQALLFGVEPVSGLSAPPKTTIGDSRIYTTGADIPTALRTILPRVMVEVLPGSNNWEQPDGVADSGPSRVFIHSIAAAGDLLRAEALDRRIRVIFSSTGWSNDRIIAAELVQTGNRVGPVTETNFNDAHRITTPFVSANVGVLG